MDFGTLIALIIIAILLYFLFKIGIIILIIVIALIVLYYIWDAWFANPKYNFQGNFEGFESVNSSNPINTFNTVGNTSMQYSNQINNSLGVQSGHNDHLYIPMQDYYDETKNSYRTQNSFNLPQSTSEYCVSQQVQQTGDLELAINNCLVPGKVNATYAY